MIISIDKFKIYLETINNDEKYFNELVSKYKYFHISKTKIPLEVIHAKTPNHPYTNANTIIEDNFTKRVSLGTSIKNCMKALYSLINNEYYVYAVDLKMDDYDNIEVINVKDKINSCPKINGKYDIDFNLKDWINEYNKINNENISTNIMSPSSLPNHLKRKFFACVPDANITDEKWFLSDLKTDYLGKIKIASHESYIVLEVNKKL